MFKRSLFFVLLLVGMRFGAPKQVIHGSQLNSDESDSGKGEGSASNEICVDDGCEGETGKKEANDRRSLLGNPCTQQIDCGDGNGTICAPIWSTSKGVFEGVCICDKNFYATRNGTVCLPKAKHGERCDPAARPCEDTNSLLTCDLALGICACANSTTQVFEAERAVCSVRVGEFCYDHRTQFHVCVAHALCKYHLGHKLPDKVRCKCQPGYHPTPDGGACLGGYGHPCAGAAKRISILHARNGTTPTLPGSDGCDTNRGLVCTNGQCLCGRPLTQVYDEKLLSCAMIVGAPCLQTASAKCVHRATCQARAAEEGQSDEEGALDGLCVCNVEHSATGDGTACKKRHGAACSSSDEGSTCNPDSGLVCRGGRCECFDPSLRFDPAKDACVNRASGVCGRLPASVHRPHWIWKAAGTFRNETQAPVSVGCEEGLLCTRIQGQPLPCRCLAAEALELDRTYRIALCL